MADTSDEDEFVNVCNREFDVTPNIVAARRLGRTRNDGNLRRLLVVLTTSADASSSTLLELSRQFLSLLDDHIRRNLYFNPDMTKQEAQIAYEERVRRRQARAKRNTHVEGHQEVHLTSSTFTSSLRPTAPSFPPPAPSGCAWESVHSV